ncbi:MAG TPA: hypothetical protein DDX07_04045, partial [Porphyromonadaceae bacterium]|nr:hypothetical protein [Porphyromonadaceae bacterium]
MVILRLFIFLITVSIATSLTASEGIRIILFTIDGLHWKAPEKLRMPVLNQLRNEGVYVEKSYMIIPHHPTVGDYSKYNSCSFPNPMLHQGSLFISSENKMVQEVVSTKHTSAFVVNTSAYRSVARGFNTSIMDSNLSDKDVVNNAIMLLDNQDIRFMRIHLQSPGTNGESVALHSADKSYSNNIWAPGSPYMDAIESADKLLGDFVSFLKESGKWANTILIVTSDHGQSDNGWHPMLDENSWITPLLFVGKGIARNRELPYFEHTDLAPTILWLLGMQPLKTESGKGIIIREIKEEYSSGGFYHPRFIKKINQQIKEYSILLAKLTLASDKNFAIA